MTVVAQAGQSDAGFCGLGQRSVHCKHGRDHAERRIPVHQHPGRAFGDDLGPTVLAQAATTQAADVSAQGLRAVGERAPGVGGHQHVRRRVGVRRSDADFSQRLDAKSMQVFGSNFHKKFNVMSVSERI